MTEGRKVDLDLKDFYFPIFKELHKKRIIQVETSFVKQIFQQIC